MPMLTLQLDVPEEVLSQVLHLLDPGSSRQGEGTSSRTFAEGSPEYEGNYAPLYKQWLRADLWEMIYTAAEAFGERPFTLDELAAELAVDPEEVRKRMRALGRSRIVSEIYETLGGRWGEGNTRQDALPWVRRREADGRWVYQFWGWQDDVTSMSEYVLDEER